MNFFGEKSSEISLDNRNCTPIDRTLPQCQEDIHTIINSTRIIVESGIEQLKMLIEAKQRKRERMPVSFADIWLQMRFLDQCPDEIIIRRLRSRQLVEKFDKHSVTTDDDDDDLTSSQQSRIKSRIFRCFISEQADQFQDLNQSYVGVMLFSYNQRMNFVINRKFCRTGDIFLKQVSSLNLPQPTRQLAYDNLLRLNFSREADKGLVALGFYYSDGRCQFDAISYNRSFSFLPDEYHIFDMFLLNHWCNNQPISISHESMKIQTLTLLIQQYDFTRRKLIEHSKDPVFGRLWEKSTMSDVDQIPLAIEAYLKPISNEIQTLKAKIHQ